MQNIVNTIQIKLCLWRNTILKSIVRIWNDPIYYSSNNFNKYVVCMQNILDHRVSSIVK